MLLPGPGAQQTPRAEEEIGIGPGELVEDQPKWGAGVVALSAVTIVSSSYLKWDSS